MSGMAHAFAAELERETPATRRLLERVPDDRLDWQPHPKSMTLGQLALHVASIPGRMAQLAQRDGFDASGANFTPPQPQAAAELVPMMEAGVAEARSFLQGLDDDAAGAPWKLSNGEREIFTVPRVGMVRTMLLNHWYHHRGQLAVYLRLLDVPVPGAYGPTADE